MFLCERIITKNDESKNTKSIQKSGSYNNLKNMHEHMYSVVTLDKNNLFSNSMILN